MDANAKAQDLRRDDKLSAAREQLRLCASPSCPAVVRADCTKRLDELEAVQPAIIFEVKDGSGRDLSLVTVTADGRPLAEKLDGKALQVDPGEHIFVFTVPDQAPVTESFVLREGDKERRERIVIGAPVLPTAAPVSTETPRGAQEAHGLGGQKVVGLIAGGVGVAGIAVGSVFGLLTASAINQQKADCTNAATAATCPRPQQAVSDHSTWTTNSTISTTAFIAGGALLVTGVVLFFTGHRSSERPVTSGLVLLPSVRPTGGTMFLRGEF